MLCAGATSWTSDDSFDKYEIGDLSNKFEYLTGKNNYQLEVINTHYLLLTTVEL